MSSTNSLGTTICQKGRVKIRIISKQANGNGLERGAWADLPWATHLAAMSRSMTETCSSIDKRAEIICPASGGVGHHLCASIRRTMMNGRTLGHDLFEFELPSPPSPYLCGNALVHANLDLRTLPYDHAMCHSFLTPRQRHHGRGPRHLR